LAWTTPRTWTTGELVTAAMMNTHVRDNENYLYDALLPRYDSFTRADSATTLGNSEGPGTPAWSALNGTWGISGNAAYIPTPAANVWNIAKLGAGSPNYRVRLGVVVATASGPGIAFRIQDVNNFWSWHVDIVNSKISLMKMIAGTPTEVNSFAAATSNGDTYILEVEAHGNILLYRAQKVASAANLFSAVSDESQLATAQGVGLSGAEDVVFSGTENARYATWNAEPLLF